MTKSHRPPPTKFGSDSPAQAKPGPPAATGRMHVPPPTRFAGPPAVQPKAAAPAAGRTHVPPPTRFAGPLAAQPKWRPAGPSIVQMMEPDARSGGDSKRARRSTQRYDGYYTGEAMDEGLVNELSALGDDRPLVEYTTDDGEDYAYVPPGSTESPPYNRPSWRVGTYERIAQNQTQGRQLICALCRGVINVDANGKEVWLSKSGREHRTRPPIDHANPDWIVRIREIKGMYDNKEGTDMSRLEFDHVRNEVEEAYHADDLQIAHMICNSRKAKA